MSHTHETTQADGGEARIVEERHVTGTNGEDQIEAVDDRGRRWYHPRPGPSRRTFMGLESWWMALGWPLLILLLLLPYPWWW